MFITDIKNTSPQFQGAMSKFAVKNPGSYFLFNVCVIEDNFKKQN